MNKQDIQIFYKYNNWANKRIMDTAAQVTKEQFLAPAPLYPHGGLRSTLTHALFAEWIWLKRWKGEAPSQRMKPEDFPTFEALQARWTEEEQALNTFLESLTDEKLNAPFYFKTTQGAEMENILWHAMVHVVNHGTQHRTEAAVMLTDFDHSPGEIDMIGFFRELK